MRRCYPALSVGIRAARKAPTSMICTSSSTDGEPVSECRHSGSPVRLHSDSGMALAVPGDRYGAGDPLPQRRYWRAAYKVNFFTWILLSSNMPRPSEPAISICSTWQFRNWLALSGFDNAIDATPTSARLASVHFQPVL